MLNLNLPPAAVSINMRTFLDSFGRYVATGELVDVDAQRDAQGQDDAEFAHSAFACLDVVCRQERCVALQERILAAYPSGFSVCHVCRQTVSNSARLSCGSCAS